MTRRELLQELGGALTVTNLGVSSPAGVVESLPGTQPLTWDGDLAERLMALTSLSPARSPHRARAGQAYLNYSGPAWF